MATEFLTNGSDRPTQPWSQAEVYSIEPVPDALRHGRVRDQFTMWFGLNANLFVVVLGAVLVEMGLSLLWATTALVVGVTVGQLLVCFHAIQGPRLGVPQMIQSRGQFGFHGALFVLVASIVLDIGFLAAQLVLQALTMNLLIAQVSVPVWIVVLVVPVSLLTFYGHDWLHRWQRWMSVALGATFVVVMAQTLAAGALNTSRATSTETPTLALFMGGVSLFVIAVVSWAPYVSDYSRYLPANVSQKKVFWAVFAGSAIPTLFCAFLGACLVCLLPSADSTVAAIASVSGHWVLVVMALSLIGSDVANAYTGMLAVLSVVSSVRQVRPGVAGRAVAGGAVILTATLCALFGYQNFITNLTSFLEVLLFVFIPWSAINLIDYYVVKRGDYDVDSFVRPHGLYPAFMWPGLVAYFAAVLIQLPFVAQVNYTGAFVDDLNGVDISWIVGGLAGAGLYLLAVRADARWAAKSQP